MIQSDFEHYKISNFSLNEIANTGANILDVNVFLFVTLQLFRVKLDRAIVLLYGGITTGVHSSFQHMNGTAVDITFREGEGEINIGVLHNAAQEAGFSGFGAYWNGTAFSFHLDLGPSVRSWLWWKRHREEQWHKESIYKNPLLFTR